MLLFLFFIYFHVAIFEMSFMHYLLFELVFLRDVFLKGCVEFWESGSEFQGFYILHIVCQALCTHKMHIFPQSELIAFIRSSIGSMREN